jgi:hypothetical protein
MAHWGTWVPRARRAMTAEGDANVEGLRASAYGKNACHSVTSVNELFSNTSAWIGQNESPHQNGASSRSHRPWQMSSSAAP